MVKIKNLTEKRRKHVKSCRENSDNSHDMIAGLYSDPSHFIYELLQNADDAKASRVKFSLSIDNLSISHNGEKLFDFDDIDSITTVGSSTKKGEVNAIGTFGAGFKSVFAITETPEIHSGGYHFKIVDFIVPEEIDEVDSNETVIILPFNHSTLSPSEAYEQIAQRLEMLEAESLLFLYHIKEIIWETESKTGHYYVEKKGTRASILSQIQKEETFLEYFICERNITIARSSLSIFVAYLLKDEEVTEKKANLFVFFPTNERVGFNFLVHAPYKTTPSRETIPFDDEQNKQITSELAKLIADSLVKLKEERLLSVKALSLMPIDNSNEHPLYQAAFEEMKAKIETEPLLPTEDGSYQVASKSLLAREKDLTNLLLPNDIKILFERNAWLSTAITRDKTLSLREYIMGLGIPEITMEKFCKEISSNFIKNKDDAWIVSFYQAVTNNKALYRKYPKGVLLTKPIIRLEDGSHVCPEDDKGGVQVYLPAQMKSKFKTVRRSITDNEQALEFLKSLELKQPDQISEVKEFIVPKYQGKPIDLNDYINDFEKVQDIWQKADKYQKQEVVDLLKESYFVRCRGSKGCVVYQKPTKVYFATEKLSSWFEGNTEDDFFFLELGKELSTEDRKFLEALGMSYELHMQGIIDVKVDRWGDYKRSVNGFNPDFNIHGLEYALGHITIERSLLLWAILLKRANKLEGYIESKSNKSSSYKKGKKQESKVKELLNKYQWLFGESKTLITEPIDQVMLDDLNSAYEKKSSDVERLVKVLGMKLDEVAKFEEEHPDKKVISNEDYQLLAKIKAEQQKGDADVWEPEVSADDVKIDSSEYEVPIHLSDDLGNQSETQHSEVESSQTDGNKKKADEKSKHNNKEIGDWGEKLAYKHLCEEFSDDEVIWLNESQNIGKGYDFVVRRNNEDYAYFEVKAKLDDAPQLFKISGAQWNWAKELYQKGSGDKYRILLITNAGKESAKIKTIKNPVKLWQDGKLYAHPVDIEL